MHTCHLPGCFVEIPPRLLFCPRHWRQVPKAVQAQVWATYRPGQEVDKDPSEAYLAAAKAAIAAVLRQKEPSVSPDVKAYYDILEAIDQGEFSVSKWEADFINGLLDERPGYLSQKQRDVIDRMQEKYL